MMFSPSKKFGGTERKRPVLDVAHELAADLDLLALVVEGQRQRDAHRVADAAREAAARTRCAS